jgi:hypothetical protein
MFLLKNKPRFNLGTDHVERPYKTSGESLSTKQLNLPINNNPFIRKGKSNEWALNISDDDENSYGSIKYNDNAISTEEYFPLVVKEENNNNEGFTVINQEGNQQQENESNDESDMEIDIDIDMSKLPGSNDKRKKVYKKISFPSYKLKLNYK